MLACFRAKSDEAKQLSLEPKTEVPWQENMLYHHCVGPQKEPQKLVDTVHDLHSPQTNKFILSLSGSFLLLDSVFADIHIKRIWVQRSFCFFSRMH